MSLKTQITDKKIEAMKSKEKFRRDTFSSILAKIKQKEVDERIELTDNDILVIITKMIKERKDSIVLFAKGDRQDLVEKETNEISIISEFLPTQLTDEEINTIIQKAIEEVQPKSMKEMSVVMALIKPQIQGKANIGAVSGLVKNIINSQ